MGKKRWFIVSIVILIVVAIAMGIRRDEYVTMFFNVLQFHTPLELESVTYSDVEYLGAPIVFDEEEELTQWREGFLSQLNSTTFKRDNCYYMASMDGVIITFKFEGYEEPLRVVYKEPDDVRILDWGWITEEDLKLPFEREDAESLFSDKYPEIYLQQFE